MTGRSQEELVAMLRSTRQGESVSVVVARQEDIFLPRELVRECEHTHTKKPAASMSSHSSAKPPHGVPSLFFFGLSVISAAFVHHLCFLRGGLRAFSVSSSSSRSLVFSYISSTLCEFFLFHSQRSEPLYIDALVPINTTHTKHTQGTLRPSCPALVC